MKKADSKMVDTESIKDPKMVATEVSPEAKKKNKNKKPTKTPRSPAVVQTDLKQGTTMTTKPAETTQDTTHSESMEDSNSTPENTKVSDVNKADILNIKPPSYEASEALKKVGNEEIVEQPENDEHNESLVIDDDGDTIEDLNHDHEGSTHLNNTQDSVVFASQNDESMNIGTAELLEMIKVQASSTRSLENTMDKLNNNIVALTDTMKTIKIDMETNHKDHQTRLDSLETKLTSDYADIVTMIGSQVSVMKTEIKETKTCWANEIKTLTAQSKENKKEIDVLREMIKLQKDEIELLKNGPSSNEEIKRIAQQALELANSVESHGRKWAFRILGLEEPGDDRETTAMAKQLVANFIQEKLKLEDFTVNDIDCAHRVGRIVDKKQTMLVRLYSRDKIAQVQASRTELKATGLVLYEDCTQLDRLMINDLKKKAKDGTLKIDSVWCNNGKIYIKKTPKGRKIKIGMHDDVTVRLMEI
jgi:hypothetical protein